MTDMTQAPTPGPLTSESIKLLRKGDRVRWLCEKDHYGTFVALMDSEGGGIQWHSDHWGRNHYSPSHMIEFVSRPAPPREDLGDGVWADVEPERLAPPAPVEASGSEREHGPKCWGMTSLSDEKAYCYCGSEDRPQPSGETREAVIETILIFPETSDLNAQMAEDLADRILAPLSARPLALGGQHSGGEVDDFRKMVEAKLAEAMRADLADAPFPMDERQAASYHRTRADLLGWVLDMLPPVDGPIVPITARAEALDEGAAGERVDRHPDRVVVPRLNMKMEISNAIWQLDRGEATSARVRMVAALDILSASRAHPSPTPAAQDHDRVRRAARALLEACIKDFGDPAEFQGDDGAVASGHAGDCAVTFKHMRDLTEALKSTAAQEGEKS